MKDTQLYALLQEFKKAANEEQVNSSNFLLMKSFSQVSRTREFYEELTDSELKVIFEQYLHTLDKANLTEEDINDVKRFLQTCNINADHRSIIPSLLSIIESFRDKLFSSEVIDQLNATCSERTQDERSSVKFSPVTDKPKDFVSNGF